MNPDELKRFLYTFSTWGMEMSALKLYMGRRRIT
jgi:hypothetical protein